MNSKTGFKKPKLNSIATVGFFTVFELTKSVSGSKEQHLCYKKIKSRMSLESNILQQECEITALLQCGALSLLCSGKYFFKKFKVRTRRKLNTQAFSCSASPTQSIPFLGSPKKKFCCPFKSFCFSCLCWLLGGRAAKAKNFLEC